MGGIFRTKRLLINTKIHKESNINPLDFVNKVSPNALSPEDN